MSTAVKLSEDLVASARAESKDMNRSMTQQIEHWARIGRALEHMPGVTLDNVRHALNASMAFDALCAEERALALGELERMMVEPKGEPALHRELRAQGTPYVILDDDGRVVEIAPDGSVNPLFEARDTDKDSRRQHG